jgi:hypothetical protein
MGLAHRRVQPAGPDAVQVAEPGIAEAIGRAGAVLLPQQCQSHIGTAKLAMHQGPVRHWALIRRDVRRRRKQHRFQLHVVEIVRQRPDDTGTTRSAQIPAYRSLAQPQALGNRPLRQLARIPQPQNFSDLAHRQSLGWHPIPPLLGKETSLPSVENCRRCRPLHPHLGLITITEIDDHVRPDSMITFHRIE